MAAVGIYIMIDKQLLKMKSWYIPETANVPICNHNWKPLHIWVNPDGSGGTESMCTTCQKWKTEVK